MNSSIQKILTLFLRKYKFSVQIDGSNAMTQDKKVYYDLAYLVSCALKGDKPSLDNIDLVKVKEEAKKDSILPLIGISIPQFKESFYSNVYRISNFEKCKNQLYEFFDNCGIFHCSLKGMVVKEYYPQTAMRYNG